MYKLIIFLFILLVSGAIFFFVSQNRKQTASSVSTKTPSTNEQEQIPNAKTVQINTQKSSVTWSAKKIVGSSSHTGTVEIQKGILLLMADEIVGGDFTIDMNTIQNSQVGAGDRLVGHLKSSDFFDVQQFPEAQMTINKIEKINGSDNNFLVTGNLTIKGIANEITYPATIQQAGEQIIADANFSIDRTKWSVTYGSGSFFDNIGDEAIDDLITYDIHLEN